MALHAHKVDSKFETTLIKVVSMLIHHLVSAGNLHAKDFIICKKKKKCERSSAKIFQHGDVKWSAAAKGMLCSAMNVEKKSLLPR